MNNRTTLERAQALGADPKQLRKRLRKARAVLLFAYRMRFKPGRFDFAGKRLVSDDGTLELRWEPWRTSAGAVGLFNVEPESLSTLVVFRRWRAMAGEESAGVLALFPLVPYSWTSHGLELCASYMHVGQHGSADYAHCIVATRPADLSEPDVAALKRELESPPYNYRLRVAKRSPSWRAVQAERERTRKAGL